MHGMLSSLRKKLLDNSVLADVPEAATFTPLLTHIPWTLVGHGDDDDPHFPKASYLDLRRQQNQAWAEERLVQGIDLAKNPATRSQAEGIYQQGLEVCPYHSNLLTAYGALLANLGRTAEAIETLDKAIQVDPDHEQANLYRGTILKRMEKEEEETNKKPPPKHEMVAEDAEMEEEIEIPGADAEEIPTSEGKETTMHLKPSKEDPGTRGYSLVEEQEEDVSSSDSEANRKRKKKKRKKRRKRKHYSSDDDSSDSESSRRRRKRRKKKRKRKERRKRERREKRSASSDEESRKDSQGEVDSANKREDKKRERKEKRRTSSDEERKASQKIDTETEEVVGKQSHSDDGIKGPEENLSASKGSNPSSQRGEETKKGKHSVDGEPDQPDGDEKAGETADKPSE